MTLFSRLLRWLRGPSLEELAPIVCSMLWVNKPGRVLREELKRRGMRFSLSGFYRRMAELEERGIVRGYYEVNNVEGQVLKKRWYAKGSIRV